MEGGLAKVRENARNLVAGQLGEIDRLVQTILDQVRLREAGSAEATKKESHSQNAML
jgi:hypothetical protein